MTPTRLEELLDRLHQAGRDRERVSVGAMLEAVGRSSFGPLVLVPGLIALSPLSGIPGVPTTVAVMVLLVTVQFLAGRRYFWLPRWLLRRSASRDKFDKALKFLRPVARMTDRVVRPRLTVLTHDLGLHAIALVCVLVAVAMPPMEVLPLANSLSGAALSAFGLALVVHDGVLALVAFAFCLVTVFVLFRAVL